LLAKALGATVYPNGVKEIGWYEIELLPKAGGDPLLDGCQPRQTVFQWHGDTFDLPRGAVHLAESKLCRHQAFRYGRAAWGLQFHIEMTPELIDCWLGQLEDGDEAGDSAELNPRAIRAGTAANLARMKRLGDVVLPRFAALCRG
jgi:GMP synthase-like glutamine amidotransferase